MQYKKNYEDTRARLTAFYSGHAQNQIFGKIHAPSPTLERYALTDPDCEISYPEVEKRERFWDSLLRERTQVLDDSIPSAYMSEFDEGLYSALAGGEIRFMNNSASGWVSSMNVPFVEKAEDLLDVSFKRDGIWSEVYEKQLEYYAAHAENKYGISHFILIDGLNFLLELRGGTNMYYDCMDHEETVRHIIALAKEINVWVQDTYFEKIGLYDGGTISNFGQWIPGRVVSESLDPFHMTSADFFREWGIENIENVLSHYDGGVIHIHSNGHHLIEAAAGIDGLMGIYLLDENHNPVKNYTILEELRKKCGDIPMFIDIPYEVMTDKLASKTLCGNTFYNITGVPDIETGNRLMEDVYAYRT